MKKLTAILLLLSYLATTGVFAFNIHYCGGQLDSVKLAWGKTNSTCGCSSKKMDKGCCKDKQVVVKVKDSHKSNNPHFVFKAAVAKFIATVPYNFQWSTIVPTIAQLSNLFANAPPIKASARLFILHCVFRI